MDRVQQVAAGYRHTLVLTERGTVYGMGSNRRYELALPSQQKSVGPVKIQTLDLYNIVAVRAGSFSAALNSEQEVILWGTGEFGQVQVPIKLMADGLRFRDLALGKGRDSFGAAIDNEGFLYTWGDNTSGQLGHGDFAPKKVPSKVNQLRKKRVNQVVCGSNFIVALGKDVPEGYVKPKRTRREKKEEPQPPQ
jgi:alpha-tubulin suppressor-like RCC1 family protein